MSQATDRISFRWPSSLSIEIQTGADFARFVPPRQINPNVVVHPKIEVASAPSALTVPNVLLLLMFSFTV